MWVRCVSFRDSSSYGSHQADRKARGEKCDAKQNQNQQRQVFRGERVVFGPNNPARLWLALQGRPPPTTVYLLSFLNCNQRNVRKPLERNRWFTFEYRAGIGHNNYSRRGALCCLSVSSRERQMAARRHRRLLGSDTFRPRNVITWSTSSGQVVRAVRSHRRLNEHRSSTRSTA